MAPRFPRILTFPLCLVLLALAGVLDAPARAQTPEYRAYWVDTFNTQLGTHAEIDRLIGNAVDSRANALFAQIRRRGDSWYLDTLEPLTQVAGVGEPGPDGTWTFDPLRYLIDQAHLRGIEVHAFVIIGSIYNAHPTITGLPKDPKHVFNQHFWDKDAVALYPDADPRQWSTRALPHNTTGVTFNGHRFTSAGEWYIDLGHPDAEAYTVDVLTHLVRQYDLDGIHLDRIRYPEAPIDQPSGGIPVWGINVGYNETSVNRFKSRYGSAATYYTDADIGTNVSSATAPRYIVAGDVGYPKTTDDMWEDWRREQVTNFVRRLYLNVTAVKPTIKVSAALICFWTGPVGSGGWERTEAHYRVFQDWRSWTQEGILDIVSPMIYKREHVTGEQAQFDDWLSFTKSLAAGSGRHAMPGLGVYLNSIEGTLRQARRALARSPFDVGNSAADGIIFYALGSTVPGIVVGNSTNAAVTANPFSYPVVGQTTPKRTNAEFFSAMTTGASIDGATLFEDPSAGPLFTSAIPTPDMPWKSAPTTGHVMGFAKVTDGTPLDGAIVTIESISSPGTPRIVRTDGGGFFGTVGLAPGTYRARAELGSVRLDACPFEITPGMVTSADASLDATAPVTTATLDPGAPTGLNGWYLGDVQVSLAGVDGCSGVSSTEYSLDGGATWQPYAGAVVITTEGTNVFQYRSVDAAGNVELASSVTIPIDKTDPTLALASDRTMLWPPNGHVIDVLLSATGADAVSGLAGVTYEVIDEYGVPVAIAPRVLAGATAAWSDQASLVARRNGDDLDGREYRIVATLADVAGRTATASVRVLVPHDQR